MTSKDCKIQVLGTGCAKHDRRCTILLNFKEATDAYDASELRKQQEVVAALNWFREHKKKPMGIWKKY